MATDNLIAKLYQSPKTVLTTKDIALIWEETNTADREIISRSAMKMLKFAENLVPLVLSGEKTSTWRLFDDKDLQKGDELSLIDRATGQEFTKARIISVREKTLGRIDDDDFDDGHERYRSKEEMIQAYRSYYGDKVTEDTVVKLVDFELL